MDTMLSQRPRSTQRFTALMDLYEKNYMLVRLLAPRLRDMEESGYVSCVEEAMPLEILDLKHERYSTSFRLTYRLSDKL